MPAMRTARRDVIIRVPKMNVETRRPSATSQLHHETEASGSYMTTSARRSTSPVKKGLHADSRRGSSHTRLRGNRDEAENYKYAMQATSTAEWNSLLIWARRQRGPQWDAATGIWQVDIGSTEYYSFGNDPARNTKLSNAVPEEVSAPAEANQKVAQEQRRGSTIDEGESELTNISGFSIEDSPPIGPGGRRSRLAR